MRWKGGGKCGKWGQEEEWRHLLRMKCYSECTVGTLFQMKETRRLSVRPNPGCRFLTRTAGCRFLTRTRTIAMSTSCRQLL